MLVVLTNWGNSACWWLSFAIPVSSLDFFFFRGYELFTSAAAQILSLFLGLWQSLLAQSQR